MANSKHSSSDPIIYLKSMSAGSEVDQSKLDSNTFTLSVMVRGEGCDVGLGLEQGTIQDNQISSSLKTSDPGQGRLNNPSSAWCFEWSKLDSSSQVSSLILQDIVNLLYFVNLLCLVSQFSFFTISSSGDLLASRSGVTNSHLWIQKSRSTLTALQCLLH